MKHTSIYTYINKPRTDADNAWFNSNHFGKKAWERGLNIKERIALERLHNPTRDPVLTDAFKDGYNSAADN